MPSTSQENAPSKRRVLNLKAFAILFGAGTLLWLGMHALHAKQIVRTSESLKQAADKSLAEDDHRRAFDLYEQYLGLNPFNVEAEEKISQLLEEHGNTGKSLQRAFQINERLLRLDTTRDDLRVRQIRIADRIGRYSDAAVHLKTMRDAGSNNSDVWHFSGIVAKDTGRFAEAIEYFQSAVNLPNPNPESFEFLAQILTNQSNEPAAAEELLAQLIASDNSAKSHQIRARWYLDQDRPMDAVPDLWIALQTEPADFHTNAMLLKAVREAKLADRSFDAEQQYQQLAAHLTQQLAADPDATKLRLYLSSALWSVDERNLAIKNLETGIARDPRQIEMQEMLVDYLVSSRNFQRAQEAFDRIPKRSMDRGRREFMRGRLLMSQKQWTPAIEAFEMSLGYAQGDANMASRARVCLALCRRESGDNVAAMDTYKSLIKANPDFEGGRLGMASAYLRSDQISLAIAEYRQLLHVDGVPEFLANLMIKNNLTLPEHSRDWAEIERIVSNNPPLIKDEIQRHLLQADLLFAKGFPSQAMELLDDAGREMPNRPEFARAYERLSAVHGDQLLDRIRKVLDSDPTNQEAHSSMLRLFSARKDVRGLQAWMDGLVSDRVFPTLGKQQRMVILAETTTVVGDSELLARGRSETSQLMLRYGQEAWRRLAAESSQFVFGYVQFLARHRAPEDAWNAVAASSQTLTTEGAAVCWVEVLRQNPDDQSTAGRVQLELSQLVDKEPTRMSLRLQYAEHLILTQQYDAAESLLKQISEHDPSNGLAFGRLAWLNSMVKHDNQQALEYSERASRLAPGNLGVRIIRGLTLAEAGRTKDGLNVLDAIPMKEQSMAAELFRARVLQLDGQTADATDIVRQLGFRRTQGNLASAEFNLLRWLQDHLDVQPPQMTSR